MTASHHNSRSLHDAHWTNLARRYLKGHTIIDVHYMTESEIDDRLWHCRPIVLTLDNGTLVYPSHDDEGNDAGALFGDPPQGDCWVLPVLR